MVKALAIEKASEKEQKKTPDMYCKTMQRYYEDSRKDRKELREDPVGKILRKFIKNLRKNNKLAIVSEATKAMDLKAMKNAPKKSEANSDEKKEEDDKNLKIVKHTYKHSVGPEYVSFRPDGEVMDIVDRGISLKGLRTIYEEYCKNEKSFEIVKKDNPDIARCVRSPGENVTHMLVKPETRNTDSYIELLWGVFRRSVQVATTEEDVHFINKELDETLGPVNVFVSHTWHYEFKTLIESVENWEKNWEKVNSKKHETFYYFIDYFAVNQHNQEGDLKNLQKVVEKAKVTCLVLEPWDRPIPLGRCWCIYEIAKTELYPSTRLNVAFPRKEITKFKKNFFDYEHFREISRIIEDVDSANADASYKPDKEMIQKDIKRLGGFQMVNELCIRNLRKWLIEQACEFADEEARGDYYKKSKDHVAIEKAFWVLKNVGTFLRHQGKFDKSVKYLNKAITVMEKCYAVESDEKQEDKDVSVNPYNFARAWDRFKIGVDQKFKDEETRKKKKEHYLKLLNSLANSLTDDKQFEEAEMIYRQAFDWRRDLLTMKAKDTKMTQFNLGVCYIHLGNYKDAEDILNVNLNLWTEKEQKYRYWALFNLADIKSKTNRLDDAEKDFVTACDGLHKLPKVKEKDRFLSLAKVLYSKHLLRVADKCEDPAQKRKLLDKALDMATLAYNNFRQNSDLTHPDTRLAARAKRRLEITLNRGLIQKENKFRCALMEKMYKRQWKGSKIESCKQVKKNEISFMHWNILADKLAYPDFKKGGFGCSYDLLDWDRCRKDKVISEIIKYDPDVLVLVELDHYEDIRFVLQEDFGYQSVWKKKNKNFYTDGTGIFWKKDKFDSRKMYKKPLTKKLGSPKETDQVFVAVELFPSKESGENFVPFVVGGCHLKSTKASKGENIRLDQCKQIMDILNKEFGGRPVILGADMNAEAISRNYDALAYPYIVENGMISAYASVLRKEPEYTSWKFRLDEYNDLFSEDKVTEWKYTIDFIFHTKELETLAVLDVPEEKEIDNAYGDSRKESEDSMEFARRRCLLPNARCPSDHLSILAKILLPEQMVGEDEKQN